jgi:hypothetical protein
MSMTDKERYEWAEKLVAANKAGDVEALKQYAAEGDAAGHSEEDIAAILNIAMDLQNHDAAETEEVTSEAQVSPGYAVEDEEDNLDRNRN